MIVSKDVYVSYRGARRRVYGAVARPNPVVFVDVNDTDVNALRTLPRTLTHQLDGLLLIRGPILDENRDEFLGKLASASPYWGVKQRIAVITHPVGSQPLLFTLRGDPLPDDDGWTKRARAVELEALLEHAQAIWRPRNYHYRLMTGEHAESYVKVADAIREPRDAEVLASWLLQHVESGTGLLLDSGTLTPVAQALDLLLAESNMRLGQVRVLDQLARMATDVDALVDRTCGKGGRLLAIVSVSSSGSMVQRIISALDRRGPSMSSTTVAVMVDKGNDNPDPARVDIWTPLEYDSPLVERGDFDDVGCKLCRTPGKAAVVPINPMTFDAMLPAQLRPVVPDLDDPRENRPLWEAAFRTAAITVECSAVMAMRPHRSDKVPMGIKFDLERLITDEELVARVQDRIRQAQTDEGLVTNADLVLVAEHEHTAAFHRFWPKVADLLTQGNDPIVTFPADGDFSRELCTRIRSAQRILVFGLGTVTGASLQRALVGVQTARKRAPDFSLHGFVIHARPATALEWRTMRNSFGQSADGNSHLHYGWLTILPDRSPLREEGRFLTLLDNSSSSKLSDRARRFLEERMSLCQRDLSVQDEEGEQGARDPIILWGVPPNENLTPNSIYGQGLDAVTTYVAVGSAMAAQLARETSGVPELRVFEVASLARSYFDPIILSCFFRWMRPHESFWGWTAVEASTTAMHIVNRANGDHRMLIVPEMLLASGQGKLTTEAADVFSGEAKRMLEKAEFGEVHPALEVGLALLSKADAPQPTEGLYPRPSRSA